MKSLNTWGCDMNETIVWSMIGIAVVMCLGLALYELVTFMESCQCVSL